MILWYLIYDFTLHWAPWSGYVYFHSWTKIKCFTANYGHNHPREARPIPFWYKFWCVMLQWAQDTTKTCKLGECLTSCTFFRWRRKQISKVVYDWWWYCDDVWKFSYEISPWNDRKLMNEKAHVWNIGIAVHRLSTQWAMPMVSESLYMDLFIHWFAVIPKWYFIWKFAHIIDRILPIITHLRNVFPT